MSTNSNLYLTWNIYIPFINNTITNQEIITILSEYIRSPKFIKQFNKNLLQNSLNEMLQLLQLKSIEIYPPLIQISTTDIVSTDNNDKTEDEYVLPQHLREYFLLYVILFSILSLIILSLICWYCTVKCFGTDKFNICYLNKNNGNEGYDNPGGKEYGSGYAQGGKNNHSSKSYNDLNLSTRVSTKDIGIEIDAESDDDENAEFVMKAYDDDEHLKYKKGNSMHESEEIQMMSIHDNDINQNDEQLTLKQKLDIQNAFDEE